MGQFAVRNEIHSALRRLLPARLPEFLAKQRWFGGKARPILSTEIADIVPMRREEWEVLLLIVTVHYADSGDESYAIPVLWAEQADSALHDGSILLGIRNNETGTASAFANAAQNPNFHVLLFEAIERELVFRGEKGELRGFRGKEFARLHSPSPANGVTTRLLSGEQSNTSIIYGERFILKFFRRIEEGINPELEIGAFLTDKAHFPQVPQLAGHLTYRDAKGRIITQGILQAFVPNRGDAWRHIVKSVAAFYELVARQKLENHNSALPHTAATNCDEIPEFARATLEPDLSAAALLGKRTAGLHRALASETTDPAFAPEPFTMEFQQDFLESLLELTSVTLNLLRAKRNQLPVEWQAKADELAQREKGISDHFKAILGTPIHAARTRIHGDYHLGQVLYTGSDFVIIDFEGEPARPLSERRTKRSPLQDVAGMMRSFHYAAFAPLWRAVGNHPASADDLKRLTPWAEAWSTWTRKRFLTEYFTTAGRADYLPGGREHTDKLLRLHLLEKAIYELSYELNNRPTWVGIPMEGIAAVFCA
jgi:trehalose synthase-fused probable maltokinase